MEIMVMIPTYNEKDNIEALLTDILNLKLDLEILVVDDASPDMTYEIVSNLSKKDSRVHLMLREKDRGRGLAGIAGFKEALKYNPKYIVEMDGDFSHQVKYIPDLTQALKSADMAIGSRYITGGKDIDRSYVRQLVSTFARKYIRFLLGVKVNDPTSGYKAYACKVIKTILPKLRARDPFIVSEVLFYANKFSFNIKEVPIEFIDRLKGISKLNLKILLRYLCKVLFLRLKN